MSFLPPARVAAMKKKKKKGSCALVEAPSSWLDLCSVIGYYFCVNYEINRQIDGKTPECIDAE